MSEPEPRKTIVVVAAVIINGSQVLVTQRPPGSHLAGAWEFPGGKVEPDEDPRDALRRELREELGIESDIGAILETTFHRYASKSVLLLFYEAHIVVGSPEPAPLEVSALQWRSALQLSDGDFPPADVPILARVRAMLGS